VGQVKSPIDDLLNRDHQGLVRAGRIVVVNRYVSDDEIESAISALDLMCTPYPRHIGSSGVVVRAAAAGRPILGSEYGWIGQTISRFELGTTCDVTNPGAFSRSLRDAVKTASQYAISPKGRRFLKYHSKENHFASWTERLRQRLGLPPAEGGCDWETIIG